MATFTALTILLFSGAHTSKYSPTYENKSPAAGNVNATSPSIKPPAFSGEKDIYYGDDCMVSRPFVKSEAYGQWAPALSYNDFWIMDSEHVVGIHSISISAGDQIDSIQVRYMLSNGSIYYPSIKHGMGMNPVTFTLGPGQYLERVEGKAGATWIKELTFTTRGPGKRRKVHGPFGNASENYRDTNFSLEGYIFSFYGYEARSIYQFGVYTLARLQKSEVYGGPGGTKFDENTNKGAPPIIVGISKLIIGHNDYIDSIQAEYLQLGRVPVLGKKHGGNGGNLTTISFDKGEVVTRMEGKVGGGYVTQLTFFTLKQVGGVDVRTAYGPFGKSGTSPFSIDGSVLGFRGGAGDYIDRIGVYYVFI